MKKRIMPERIAQSVFCIQPSRPILCTTVNQDGSDHVAPFGWCMPISQLPPMLALALGNTPQKSHTLSNIERTGEFVINLPDMEQIDSLVLSSYHTKFGENKFERSGFTRTPSCEVQPVCIEECRAHLECRVQEIKRPGDHAVILANIVCARYDSDAFSDNMMIDIRKFKPVIHLQNFTTAEKEEQVHVFLNSDSVIINSVPFPVENGKKEREE